MTDSRTGASRTPSPSIPEQFRLLIDGVHDYAIFMLDPDGYIVTWNRGAERIKGYSASEAIGQHFSMFYPESDRKAGKPQRMLDEALRSGRVEDEGWRVRKDGERFLANVVITVIRDAEGQVKGYAKVTRDITERKLAEDALHQSEMRFKLLVENVADYAILMLSPSGLIISWNQGAERINGYTAEEILGRHFSIFYPPEDIESGKPDLELEIAISQGRYEEEGWRVRKGGRRFWSNVVITPMRNHEGTLIGFAKVTRDMTERKRAREELLTSHQQMRELSQANAAKDEFLGFVAHELRTPLAVLYGSAQFLRSHYETIAESDRTELIDTVANECEQMRLLVENLLALARPQTAESLKLTQIDLNSAVIGAIADFNRRVPRRKVHFNANEDPVFASLEATYFDRVMQNLFENADKYSPPDELIDVAVRSISGQAIIEVSDRGPGVDPAELDLIFDSFYRSSRTAAKTTGKGLGLSVCKRLIDVMDGTIEARTRLGGGLLVRVTLPQAAITNPK
ncbi:MAG TPA: PAS domain S-box protein [Dehalococcoidia bacterium]|nr:PAS domain S-box protein [Dehalococcoidia bacterium]